MAETDSVLDRVRRALGRNGPLLEAPTPPAIDEPITRLVHSDIGLPELFAKRAEEMKMHVESVHPEELVAKLTEFLRANDCRKLVLADTPLLRNLQLLSQLQAGGFDVISWADTSRGDLYEADCGVTDVTYAVAETGSLVIRSSATHGPSISLVPPIHVAIVEPRNLLPDLVDLFEKLKSDGDPASVVMITGPSKTSDIEMNLVVGVHGPQMVQLFMLK